jgi:hypothetical protein
MRSMSSQRKGGEGEGLVVPLSSSCTRDSSVPSDSKSLANLDGRISMTFTSTVTLASIHTPDSLRDISSTGPL